MSSYNPRFLMQLYYPPVPSLQCPAELAGRPCQYRPIGYPTNQSVVCNLTHRLPLPLEYTVQYLPHSLLHHYGQPVHPVHPVPPFPPVHHIPPVQPVPPVQRSIQNCICRTEQKIGYCPGHPSLRDGNPNSDWYECRAIHFNSPSVNRLWCPYGISCTDRYAKGNAHCLKRHPMENVIARTTALSGFILQTPFNGSVSAQQPASVPASSQIPGLLVCYPPSVTTDEKTFVADGVSFIIPANNGRARVRMFDECLLGPLRQGAIAH